MPVTANFSIPYPDGTTSLTPLQDKFADIANGVDSAMLSGLAGAPRLATSDTQRNTIFPSPVQGNSVSRPDKGYVEMYFGAYDPSTNPGGANPAGWYPISAILSGTGAPNGTDTGWIQAGAAGGPTFATGYSNVVSAPVPWSGVQVRRRNGTVTVSGPCIKSSNGAALETILTLPVGWRPSVTASGMGTIGAGYSLAIVRPDGTLSLAAATTSGQQISLAFNYPVG